MSSSCPRFRFSSIFIVSASLLACALQCTAQIDVLTWHNDAARTGQNLNESLLTPAQVNMTNFGLLTNVALDGKVDAQPLYGSSININGQGFHNVLYVATEHDSVYALDGDSGKTYWQKSMLAAGETSSDARSCGQVTPEIGITATPVIDRTVGTHGTIFVVAMSKDATGNYYQRVHSLDLTTGLEQRGSPVTVQATFPGAGDNSSGGVVVFDAKQYKDRPALLALNGNLYTSWGSHCDSRPYTGWMIAYNERTLAQAAVFNFSPNGSDAAPWNAGAGPAADTYGNVYVALGNGTFDTTLNAQGLPAKGDYGNSMVKLQASTLTTLDYWTMYNSDSESRQDVDLGSGGLMLLPNQKDATGTVRHLAVAAGKDSNLYVADRDNMGHYDATNDGTIYQQLTGSLPGGMWSSPAYFDGHVYYGSSGISLRSFPFIAAQLNGNSIQTTSMTFGYPGTTPSISAYGSSGGIVWATENQGSAVLRAFDATNLSTELYDSNQAPSSRDHFGAGNKFVTPTIVDGKVYVGTTNSVAIFGFIRQTPAPVADGDYTLLNNSSQLMLEDPGASKASDVAMYQASANGLADQRWFVSYNGRGYYTLQNVSSKLVLTDLNSSATVGISLVEAIPVDNDSQLWSLTAFGSGYVITNKATGLVFDNEGSTTAEGAYIILSPPNGGSEQTWILQ